MNSSFTLSPSDTTSTWRMEGKRGQVLAGGRAGAFMCTQGGHAARALPIQRRTAARCKGSRAGQAANGQCTPSPSPMRHPFPEFSSITLSHWAGTPRLGPPPAGHPGSAAARRQTAGRPAGKSTLHRQAGDQLSGCRCGCAAGCWLLAVHRSCWPARRHSIAVLSRAKIFHSPPQCNTYIYTDTNPPEAHPGRGSAARGGGWWRGRRPAPPRRCAPVAIICGWVGGWWNGGHPSE